jgi:hypothetical protein
MHGSGMSSQTKVMNPLKFHPIHSLNATSKVATKIKWGELWVFSSLYKQIFNKFLQIDLCYILSIITDFKLCN